MRYMPLVYSGIPIDEFTILHVDKPNCQTCYVLMTNFRDKPREWFLVEEAKYLERKDQKRLLKNIRRRLERNGYRSENVFVLLVDNYGFMFRWHNDYSPGSPEELEINRRKVLYKDDYWAGQKPRRLLARELERAKAKTSPPDS